MTRRPSANPCLWLLIVLLIPSALSQDRTKQPELPAWRGTWAATAVAAHSFRGHWSAQLLPGTHNAAHGSWTLVNDANQIVLEGTWSAQKSPRGWLGTWSARPVAGQRFSGTWTSNMPDFTGKTFEGMLESTIEKQVTGSWRSRRMRGDWWLTGLGVRR